MPKSAVKLLLVSVSSALALSACITVNVPAEVTATPSSAPSAPTASAASAVAPSPGPSDTTDDTAALENLVLAVGALAPFAGNPVADDCDYVSFVAQQMDGATPRGSYKGTYESIARNMMLIAGLCKLDPSAPEAVAMARNTRIDGVEILNDRQFLGMSTWG